MRSAKLVILGGGCAGLSLATALVERNTDIEVAVIEPRPRYSDDRTWSFWASQATLARSLPKTSWQRLSLSSDSRTITVQLEQPYQMIRSIDFYLDSLDRIAKSSSVTVDLGTSAYSSCQLPSGQWQTDTSNGPILSEYVVDTRPAKIDSACQMIWQSFLGREIECSAPIFNPQVAHLMDFQSPRGGEIPFLYVLPSSPTHALVELTLLGTDQMSGTDLDARLTEAIRKLSHGHGYKVLRQEYGVIPMGVPTQVTSRGATYVNAGVRSGSARPSSGYTFCRLQRWAGACADSLSSGGLPIGPIADKRLVQFMDKVFLNVLRTSPSLAPEIFLSLFEKVPMRRLLRFLSDSPTLFDALHIVGALPKLPFLRECCVPSIGHH